MSMPLIVLSNHGANLVDIPETDRRFIKLDTYAAMYVMEGPYEQVWLRMPRQVVA